MPLLIDMTRLKLLSDRELSRIVVEDAVGYTIGERRRALEELMDRRYNEGYADGTNESDDCA